MMNFLKIDHCFQENGNILTEYSIKYLFFTFWQKFAPTKTPPVASSQVAMSWLSILQFICTRMALLR
jgi:hypothetical protein